MPFERLVELGVRETMAGGRFAPRSVNVEIVEETELDYEGVFGKIERGEPLTEFERMSAEALYADDHERYVELCKEADVDVKSKLEAGEPLTVGESCVLFALLAEEDYGKYDLREIVHDDVRSVFVPF